jgi:hypothetical protein
MSDRMKRISHHSGILHVETPEGIVNIYAGLTDADGRPVTTVEAIPDQYAGAPRVNCRPRCGFRMVRNKRRAYRR